MITSSDLGMSYATTRRSRITLLAFIGLLVLGPPGEAQAAPQSEEPAILLLAPDRGFLGNEKIRDLMGAAREHVPNTAVAFATHEETRSNLEKGLSALDTEAGVVVLPLFLSPGHALYQTAREAMPEVEGGVRWARPFGESYLAEEILFDRVEALSEKPSAEHLVVVGYGAETSAQADSIRGDLRPAAERAAAKHRIDSSTVIVQYGRSAPEERFRAALEEATATVREASEEHGRILVVPYNLGMEYTTMMSSRAWVERSLRSVEGIVTDGKGVLPHPNAERWVRRTATTYRPLDSDEVGVIAVPHGSDYNWNERMRTGLAPLEEDYHVAHAFSMVDPVVIERAVRELEEAGMKAAVMVRIFSMEASFKEKAHYIVGLREEFEGGMMGDRFPPRIRTHLQMTTLGGLEASRHFAIGLLDRAREISTDPAEETVVLLAHGTGPDEENARWMENLRTIADTMRAHGGDAFRDIRVHTWREDWPEKRKETIPEIREMVRRAAEDGTALVVPARTNARGPASEHLEDLDYRYGEGFAPHPQFEAWMRDQIEQGIEQLRAAPDGETVQHAEAEGDAP